VWPTLFQSKKKRKLIKEEDISSMCDNIRIRIQNQQNNENTMAISRKRRKIIKMIDTHVMHTNMSDIFVHVSKYIPARFRHAKNAENVLLSQRI